MHRRQAEIYHNPARFKVTAAGRRFGKTILAARKLWEFAINGKRSLWIAPSYQIAEVGWRSMLKVASEVKMCSISRGDRAITIGSGWMQVRSADSEGGLRGEGLDYVVFDEAAHTRGLMDIWTQEIRPALADRKGGAMFISTPKGYNDFYELYRNAENDKEWARFQVPSWANPFLAKSEIEAARKSLPDLVFRQEFGAEFVQLAGAMFRREYFKLIDSGEVPALIDGVRFWDLAASTKTIADYTAGGKVGMDSSGNIYILDMIRRRMEWPELLRTFKQIALNDGAGILQGVETTGTQKGFLDLLLAEPSLAGISIRGYSPEKDKVTRAQPLLARAEQGKLFVVRAEWTAELINELCAFPETDHDDQVDALSGAMVMLGSGESGYVSSIGAVR